MKNKDIILLEGLAQQVLEQRFESDIYNGSEDETSASGPEESAEDEGTSNVPLSRREIQAILLVVDHQKCTDTDAFYSAQTKLEQVLVTSNF